jgi:hypothetical protein
MSTLTELEDELELKYVDDFYKYVNGESFDVNALKAMSLHDALCLIRNKYGSETKVWNHDNSKMLTADDFLQDIITGKEENQKWFTLDLESGFIYKVSIENFKSEEYFSFNFVGSKTQQLRKTS